MDDSGILELYWARNQDAIAETDKKYGSYCRQISYNILRSTQDADECVNDTWLKAWNAMPPQRPQKLQAFLGKIVRNVSLDRWDRAQAGKRGSGRAALLLSELSECVPSPQTVERALDDAAITAAISAWLRQQTPKNRVAFVRRYWYADSTAQVARQVGLAEGGVKSLLHRLRESLRNHLEQEGIVL